MATRALYLKYRPLTFDQVVGQEPITRTLRNAMRQGRLRHAYLFSGPRGTGKTTVARLLAKAVNCQAEEELRPCNECALCIAVNEGRMLDLVEIDAASNRGIDEIREIRERVGFRPNEGRFKVYVLDEAHMLTEPAFNALLKTLEEPPPHIIFALVTTDPHKIPATITSRCQRFDFRRIPVDKLVERLELICKEEGVSAEPAALEFIAHQATGAMRDAISLLDQMTSYGDQISLDQVQMVLGTVASEAAGQVAGCLADGDLARGLDLINQTIADGAEPRQFGREIVEYLRGLLLIREGAGSRLLGVPAEQAAEMEALAGRMPADRLVPAIRHFNEAVTETKSGMQTIPQLPLEMALAETLLVDGKVADSPTGSQPRPEGNALPAAPRVSDAPRKEQLYQVAGVETPAREPATPPKPETPVAEQAVPAARPDTTAPAARPAQEAKQEGVVADPGGPVPRSSGELNLDRLKRNWVEVLQAVRQRNPATQAVLNSTGCAPVEVRGNQIVMSFDYPFLRDKLRDPQRRTEVADALSEVLGARCSLKVVLTSEYTPRAVPSPSAPADQSSVTQEDGPSGTQEDGPSGTQEDRPSGTQEDRPSGTQEDRPPAGQEDALAAAPDSKPAAAKASHPAHGDFDPETVSAIAVWAKERGGQASVIET